MIGVAIAVGIVLATLVAGLMFRWIQLTERVRIEREKHGGTLRARKVGDLEQRVAAIEKYMKGE
jgi:UPF0716 family protein affecting phage T7 exclusion